MQPLCILSLELEFNEELQLKGQFGRGNGFIFEHFPLPCEIVDYDLH